MKFLLALILLAPSLAQAAEFRVRAREEYSSGLINLGEGAGAQKYDGLASAFNIWLEEPFRYGVGLTLHRGALQDRNNKNRVTTTVVGVEGKYFPLADYKFFTRGGLMSAALDPAGPPKDRWVHGVQAGLGWEFPVWKLGLAPEVGKRFMFGSRHRSWRSWYAALGIHFYVFPK